MQAFHIGSLAGVPAAGLPSQLPVKELGKQKNKKKKMLPACGLLQGGPRWLLAGRVLWAMNQGM